MTSWDEFQLIDRWLNLFGFVLLFCWQGCMASKQKICWRCLIFWCAVLDLTVNNISSEDQCLVFNSFCLEKTSADICCWKVVSYLLQAIILDHWHGSLLIHYIAAYLIPAYVRKKNNLSITLLFVFKLEQEKCNSQCLPSTRMRQRDCWWETGTSLGMQPQNSLTYLVTKQLHTGFENKYAF